MGKITIVSVTYENVVIEIKIVLPYFSCVFFFPFCVVFETIYGHSVNLSGRVYSLCHNLAQRPHRRDKNTLLK